METRIKGWHSLKKDEDMDKWIGELEIVGIIKVKRTYGDGLNTKNKEDQKVVLIGNKNKGMAQSKKGRRYGQMNWWA